MKISEAELLDALASASRGVGPEDARTVAEIREDTGFSREKVMAALHASRKAGRLVLHHVERVGIDGRRARVPAYTITPLDRPSPTRTHTTARQ